MVGSLGCVVIVLISRTGVFLSIPLEVCPSIFLEWFSLAGSSFSVSTRLYWFRLSFEKLLPLYPFPLSLSWLFCVKCSLWPVYSICFLSQVLLPAKV